MSFEKLEVLKRLAAELFASQMGLDVVLLDPTDTHGRRTGVGGNVGSAREAPKEAKSEGSGVTKKRKENKHNERITSYASPPPRNPAVRTFPWFKISQKESFATGPVCAAVGCVVESVVGFAVGVPEGFTEGLILAANPT